MPENPSAAAGVGQFGDVMLLRAILDSSGDCIKVLDLDGRLKFMSGGGQRVMEVDDFEALRDRAWLDMWEGPHHPLAAAAVEAARGGSAHRFQAPANTAKGTPRIWDVVVSPIRSGNGDVTHLLSISRDITEEWRADDDLKRALERESILATELKHRIKNILALVMAIANQTLGDTDIPARQRLVARLTALATAQDGLALSGGDLVDVGYVTERALAPHHAGTGRVVVKAPTVSISANQALALSLSLHELATNATKYGALSSPDGGVLVEWSTPEIDGQKQLILQWIEQGGPALDPVAPRARGFGSRLLERVLTSEFGGTLETVYAPEGLRLFFRAPLPEG
ncbi:MAG: PAS domain-containing protein [Alphaproteobacteria bacterium]|nr:PAS domain-containing protein [Alphaproteobacteria bacterium]